MKTDKEKVLLLLKFDIGTNSISEITGISEEEVEKIVREEYEKIL